MKKCRLILETIIWMSLLSSLSFSEPEKVEPLSPTPAPEEAGIVTSATLSGDYKVGIDDILVITVLQPDKIDSEVTVSPDGSIAFPYIGNVVIKGLTLDQIRQQIQSQLADGYFRYPLVVVSLKESRSRKFFVYGEIIKPGPYLLEEHTTVLRAISMAGGFTRFGSASHVKILRSKSDNGYDTIPVNIKSVMEGHSEEDVGLTSGDIVVVSEGAF